ncbi:hypothetical protein K1719_027351 [Acacia pycnantha]|nr:hypothetical protein K1719_027351 [Acacia pycnantha]
MWKPVSQLKLIDLDEDCFLVQFKEDMDYQNALLSGPWMIFGHYFTVHPWSPSFRNPEHVINQVIGWIRLLKLPTHYYRRSIIRSFGSVFGKVIWVDYNIDSGDRGKFARISVGIDLTKPLISKIQATFKNLARKKWLPDTSSVVPNSLTHEVWAPNLVSQARDLVNFGDWILVQRRSRRTTDKADRKNATNGGKTWPQNRVRLATTSLDKDYNSVILINDHRLAQKNNGNQTQVCWAYRSAQSRE